MFRSLFNKIKAVLIIFIIKYPTYFVCGLFIRNNKRWVFGSLYGFGDNTKYFYLNVFYNHKDIDAVYFLYNYDEYKRIKNTGLNVCYAYSLKSIFYLLTSKVYIGTHGLGYGIPKVTARKASYIELWHGTPIKKIGYLDNFSQYKIIQGNFKRRTHKFLYYFTPSYTIRDLFVSTSDFVSDLFQRSFSISDEFFINSYYPRCNVFFWSANELQSFIIKHESPVVVALHEALNNYDEAFLYMPTFRDGNPNFLSEAHLDFFKLNKLMQDRNSIFYLKLHPHTPPQIQGLIKSYSNLILLPSTMDIYTLLPKVDVLITDYSSIYIDFMLNKKGNTIFFPYDYDEYISKSRELAFDYNENIAGIRVDTFKELLDSIKTDNYKDFDPNKKQNLLNKFWGRHEDKQNLVKAIKKLKN